MKVEVAVLGSPSLISLTVSVDVKRHHRNEMKRPPNFSDDVGFEKLVGLSLSLG